MTMDKFNAKFTEIFGESNDLPSSETGKPLEQTTGMDSATRLRKRAERRARSSTASRIERPFAKET